MRNKNSNLKKEGRNVISMGMTDSQFKAFVRFLIDALKDAKEEEEDKKDQKLDKIIENLQSSLED